MKEEIWLPVPVSGFEELYNVSNFGNVMSLNYRCTGRKELLSTVEDRNGYLQVCLSKNGKHKTFQVHRLVAEAFLPNLFDESQVNHRDENKKNNFCGTPENNFNDGNLEWCSAKYNNNYGTRIERMSKTVLQFTKTGELVREWSSTIEAARSGFNQGTVAACCRGERKSHKGYIWKYK